MLNMLLSGKFVRDLILSLKLLCKSVNWWIFLIIDGEWIMFW